MAKTRKRTIMRDFSINEISAVDVPAQEGALAVILKRHDPASPAGDGKVGKKEDLMADHKKTDEVTVETLKAQLARATALASLNDAEKSHIALFDDAEVDVFLAKSAGDRKTEVEAAVAKAAEKNPVVYKTADGVEIRKDDGETVLALAKSNDALRKSNDTLADQVTKANEIAKDAEYVKRAGELDHIPGDEQTRIEMLKAIDGIADEERRQSALTSLKAQNAALASAFKATGSAAVPAAAGSPEAELDEMAKAYAKEHNVTPEAAYDAVLKTAEGADLYSKAVN